MFSRFQFFILGKDGKHPKIHGLPLPKNLPPIRFQPEVFVFFPFPNPKPSSFWGRWTMVDSPWWIFTFVCFSVSDVVGGSFGKRSCHQKFQMSKKWRNPAPYSRLFWGWEFSPLHKPYPYSLYKSRIPHFRYCSEMFGEVGPVSFIETRLRWWRYKHRPWRFSFTTPRDRPEKIGCFFGKELGEKRFFGGWKNWKPKGSRPKKCGDVFPQNRKKIWFFRICIGCEIQKYWLVLGRELSSLGMKKPLRNRERETELPQVSHTNLCLSCARSNASPDVLDFLREVTN